MLHNTTGTLTSCRLLGIESCVCMQSFIDVEKIALTPQAKEHFSLFRPWDTLGNAHTSAVAHMLVNYKKNHLIC